MTRFVKYVLSNLQTDSLINFRPTNEYVGGLPIDVQSDQGNGHSQKHAPLHRYCFRITDAL
jgi:hypothetical protein